MSSTVEQATDLITREVCHAGIKATVDEMEVLIGRTSMSEGFRDKKDYFIGLFDPSGRMIHALTSYSGAGMATPILKTFPPESFAPGDLYFFNDPYSSDGAVQHVSDVVVAMPIFAEDELLCIATGFGHVSDLGGAGKSPFVKRITDVFQEGVAYPPMQVGRGGRFDDQFLRLFTRNSRRPDVVRGDLNALIAACLLAEDRLVTQVAKYGLAAFHDTVEWAIQRSSEAVWDVLDQHVPDGEFRARQVADLGLGSDATATIDVRLQKKGRDLSLDLTRSSDQVPYQMNYTCSRDGLRLLLALQLLVYDGSLDMNQGTLETVNTVRFREGSIVKPRFPAPLQLRSQVKSTVANCLATILAEASGGWMTAPQPTYVTCAFDFGGDPPTFTETLGVGLGARPFGDGPDVIYAPAQRNYPVEFVEPNLPLAVVRYAISPDSGGAGTFRGGCGAIREIEALQDCHVSPSMSNTTSPSPGVSGGHPGAVGSVEVINPDGEKTEVPGTSSSIPLPAGQRLRMTSPGGGGWGDPLDRPAEAVARDVRDGFVSREAAESEYGVVLAAHGSVDVEATRQRRCKTHT